MKKTLFKGFKVRNRYGSRVMMRPWSNTTASFQLHAEASPVYVTFNLTRCGLILGTVKPLANPISLLSFGLPFPLQAGQGEINAAFSWKSILQTETCLLKPALGSRSHSRRGKNLYSFKHRGKLKIIDRIKRDYRSANVPLVWLGCSQKYRY